MALRRLLRRTPGITHRSLGLESSALGRPNFMASDRYLQQPGFLTEFADLQHHLHSHPTLKSLKCSEGWAQNLRRIEKILENPHVENVPPERRPPRAWLRCISWNIEKGKKLDEIINIFKSDQRLCRADLILLQEADLGMARSGNRFVARELANALQMNFAFAPCFIELTKGAGDDLKATGENASGLQGNAIITRFDIESARVVRLPQCFEPFEFSEKRYGGRNALICDLKMGEGGMTVATTHLEVRNTPQCRARQMGTVLDALIGCKNRKILIGGDFNSNTFARGTLWRTMWGLFRLMTARPNDLLASTLAPQSREPLFELLRRSGFEWNPFNDGTATSFTFLRSLEDVHLIPRPLRDHAYRTLRQFEKGLPLRLDWFAARNLSPACHAGATQIDLGGDGPSPPMTFSNFENGQVPDSCSDHRPILVDLSWP